MPTKLGTSHAVGRAATGELLRRGFSRLQALFAGYVANWGDSNFQTYGRIAAEPSMLRADGRQYHPESLGRVARKLAELGVLETKRIHCGQTIPNASARFRSSHGVTVKRFVWGAIQAKNPFNRRERRQQRQKQAALLRHTGELAAPPPAREARPRHSMPPPPASTHTVKRDGKLSGPAWAVDLAELAIARQEERERREADARSGQVPGRASAPERPPPD